MKNCRASLAMLLAVAMTFGLVSPAYAYTAPEGSTPKVQVTISEEKAGNSDVPDMRKLVVKARTTESESLALATTMVALSYDNTVIQPVGCTYDSTDGTPTYAPIENNSITSGTTKLTTPFSSVCSANPQQPMAPNFTFTGAKWVVNGTRTAFQLNMSTNNNTSGTSLTKTDKTISEFTYRVIDGEKLSKDAFRIETYDAPNTLIGQLFPNESEYNGIRFGLIEKNSKDLYYGSKQQADDIAATLTYENSTIAELGTLSLVLYPADTSTNVTVDPNQEQKLTIKATAMDKYGNEMKVPATVDWTSSGEAADSALPEGVTLTPAADKASAELKISPTAQGGTAKIKIVDRDSGKTSDEITITISRPDSKPETIAFKLKDGGTVTGTAKQPYTVAKPAGSANNTVVFDVEVCDQFGETMSSDTVNITSSGGNENLTFDDTSKTLTVKPGAKVDDTITLTASIGSTVTTTLVIKVVDIEFTVQDDAITPNAATYGDTWGQIIPSASIHKEKISASVSGRTVEGTYAVATPDAKPSAGSQSYKILFTSKDGQYQGVTVPVTNNTVTVARKPITVKAADVTLVYGQDIPTSFELVKPISGLVGTDGVDALGVTLKCDAVSDFGTYTITKASEPASANYNVTVNDGTLTINKADVTPTQVTIAPILANDSTNTETGLKGKLPNSLAWTYGTDNSKSVTLDMQWDELKGFDSKGGEYTVTGRPVKNDKAKNFNVDTAAVTAAISVKPIIAKVSLDPSSATVNRNKVKGLTNPSYADFKLPASVPVTYEVDTGFTAPTAPASISEWLKTPSELQDAAKNPICKSVNASLKMPPWATVDEKDIRFTIEFSEETTPVLIKIDMPKSVVYGTALNPKLTVEQDPDEEDAPPAGVNWQWDLRWEGVAPTSYGPTSTAPTKVGTYKLTATLKDAAYSGSAEAAVTITAKDITNDADVTVSVAEGPYTYTGAPQTPTVTVTGLIKDTDYKVEYANNTNAGTATVTVTGIGNYTGSKTATFTINKYDISNPAYGYSIKLSGGSTVGSAITASLSAATTIPADIQVSWQWLKDSGSAINGATTSTFVPAEEYSNKQLTVIALGTGNYTGQLSQTVKVDPLKIYGTLVILHEGTTETVQPGDTLSVDTKSIFPALTNTDYTVTWTCAGKSTTEYTFKVPDNTAAGTAITATLNMKEGADFTGSLTASVEVGKHILSGSDYAVFVVLVTDGTTPGSPVSSAKLGDRLKAVLNMHGQIVDAKSYDVIWYRGSDQAGTGTEYTVQAADQGKTLTARVSTSETTGVLSSDVVTVPAVKPDSPVLNGSTSSGTVSLNWSAPRNDGGSPIVGYTLTWTVKSTGALVGTKSYSPNDNRDTVTGLENGTAYEFTLIAENAEGLKSSVSRDFTPASGSTPGPGPGPGPDPDYPSYEPSNPGTSGGNTGSTGNTSNTGNTSSTTPPADVTVPATQAADGGYTSSVSGPEATKVVNQANKTTGSVTIAPKVEQNAAKVSVTLPASVVSGVAASTAKDLTVSTPAANVVLKTETLNGLSGAQNVTVTAERGGGSSVSVTVAADDAALSTVPGGITVNLPLNEGTGAGTVAVLVNPDGTETVIRDSIVLGTTLVTPLDGSATVRVVDNTKYFDDMSGHWSQGSVDFVSSRELFQGTGTGASFSPDMNMSRGMLVTVMYRLDGEKGGTGSLSSFDDVSWDAWYADAVVWATGLGVANGTNDGFKPNANISRQEIAAMLYRYATAMGLDTGVSGTVNAYQDGYSVASWSREAMNWAVGAGILTGKPGNLLDPAGQATRSEVATMLERFVKFSVQ